MVIVLELISLGETGLSRASGVCVFCRTHSLFKEYESKLYRYSQQGQVTTSADSGYNVLGLFVRRIDRSVYFNVVCHQQIP